MQNIEDISTTTKLLILIDDLKNVSFDEIIRYFSFSKRIVKTNLTKLINSNFVKYENNIYKITAQGEVWLDEKLLPISLIDKNIKRTTYLIIIRGYKKRSFKTLFFNALKDIGFVSFAYQILIGNAENLSKINQLAKQFNINIETLKLSEFSPDFIKYYNIKPIDEFYKSFLFKSHEILKSNRFLLITRLRAKILVYNLSRNLSKDPRFNIETVELSNQIKNVIKYYYKIKPLCYK
ncbi:MAG: hypothetical protein UR93_C0001G0043 [Berkelbacteria bacterium GW2011_GWA2_35_9]|uniref:Uncharacterized protein n=1 Tax=Berkelbacteria bacterium GW2011_GWA2_35_9 TaxID=1618333 RepID=A0A0G0DK89_9BACT|nr:MAG: hypothetical protein UR93_C0001G0043 [Berkelbacteria bacterium GW2011_GWA2_35_9]